MRRKILYAATMTVISTTAFFIGQNTAEPEKEIIHISRNKSHLDLSNEEDFNLACDFMSQIVDWTVGTDGMAVLTADDYELYATRTQDIYDYSYIPVEDIEDFAATETGLQIYFKDGTGYYWERENTHGYK